MISVKGSYNLGSEEQPAEFIMLQARNSSAKDFIICQRSLFEFLSRVKVKQSSLRVYFYYLSKCQFGAYSEIIPQRVIANMCEMTQPQVSMALAELEKCGLLIIEQEIYDDGTTAPRSIVQFPSHMVKRGIRQ